MNDEFGGGNQQPADAQYGLRNVETRATLGDFVPIDRLETEAGRGWSVGLEIVQHGTTLPAEALVLERSDTGRRIEVIPALTTAPTGPLEWYERRHRGAARDHVRTVDSLKDALRTAINRTHQSSD